jgi:hypothetical protein
MPPPLPGSPVNGNGTNGHAHNGASTNGHVNGQSAAVPPPYAPPAQSAN